MSAMTAERKYCSYTPSNIPSFNKFGDRGGSRPYRFLILITKEEDDTYTACALNLPGAASCGDNPEEALDNAKEAIQGVMEEYLASGERIPWVDDTTLEIPEGGILKRIYLNV